VSAGAAPEFWLVAGLNGSGKSTFAARALQLRTVSAPNALVPKTCLNPDLVARTIGAQLRRFVPGRWRQQLEIAANYLAVLWVEFRVCAAICCRSSIAVETVLGSRKYLKYLRLARARGFVLGMYYVALENVEMNIERVALRVSDGGHNVPEAKIRSRALRSLDNLAAFAPLLDELQVFDNSELGGRPVLVASKQQGVLIVRDQKRLPEAVSKLCAVLR
jgi:predicted ABC-type ATPase